MRTTAAGVLLALSLAACSPGVRDGTPERFVYEGRTYELDAYETLFDDGRTLGKGRRDLYVAYLENSVEGGKRRTAANSNDPAIVWKTMAVEEKSTFVAVTNALHCVSVNGGPERMLHWIASIDEIHGETRFGGGTLSNSEAFRLWGRLTASALALLRNEAGTFRNECNNQTYDYGGSGSTHRDFCNKGSHFDSSAKFDDSPNVRGIQFNFNLGSSDCSDIDVDYSQACHLSRGNSNVLDDCWGALHINRLTSEYGSASGLRLVTNP